jgi:hypothetical protein
VLVLNAQKEVCAVQLADGIGLQHSIGQGHGGTFLLGQFLQAAGGIDHVAP